MNHRNSRGRPRTKFSLVTNHVVQHCRRTTFLLENVESITTPGSLMDIPYRKIPLTLDQPITTPTTPAMVMTADTHYLINPNATIWKRRAAPRRSMTPMKDPLSLPGIPNYRAGGAESSTRFIGYNGHSMGRAKNGVELKYDVKGRKSVNEYPSRQFWFRLICVIGEWIQLFLLLG